MNKNIAELIDELITVNIKVFMLNNVLEKNEDDTLVAEAGRKMVKLMSKRSELKNAIGEHLGDNLDEVKHYG